MRSLVLGQSLDALLDHRGKTPGKLGSDFTDQGVPVASAILVVGGRLNLSEARFVSEATYRKWMPEPTRKGDVLLTSEAPLGRVARVDSDDPLVLGQRLYGLRGTPGVLHNGFLYYALQTECVRADLIGRSTGTTVFGIRQSALRDVVIPAPSWSEQQAIAEVLGALDDKIAANLRIAAIADELVRAWYTSWAARAPGAMPLSALAEHHRVAVDPASMPPTTPYVGLEHLPRRSMWLPDSAVASGVTSGKSVFSEGDVLFGKLRPYFHKVVGAAADGICSTDILVIRANDPDLRGLVLAAAASDEAVALATASSEGTRMPRTNWKDLATLAVPWHDEASARALSADVRGMWAMTSSKFIENARLASLRDALLPLLVSGKVRVKDAEKVVEGVV
jgi:type I restriction enzyme S subunit